MSVALTLYRLQQIDSQIDQSNLKLLRINEALDNNIELQSARRDYTNDENAVKELEIKLKDAENKSEDHRIKLEQVESSLYSGLIQNPKELQDLQGDLTSLRHHLQELEDSQLDLMLSLENAREKQNSTSKNLQVVEGRVVGQNASLKTEHDQINKDLVRLQAERLAIISSIEPGSLAMYEELRQNHRGIAVTTLSDNSCTACGASLTPGQAQIVRNATKLSHCPSCSRILFSN